MYCSKDNTNSQCFSRKPLPKPRPKSNQTDDHSSEKEDHEQNMNH